MHRRVGLAVRLLLQQRRYKLCNFLFYFLKWKEMMKRKRKKFNRSIVPGQIDPARKKADSSDHCTGRTIWTSKVKKKKKKMDRDSERGKKKLVSFFFCYRIQLLSEKKKKVIYHFMSYKLWIYVLVLFSWFEVKVSAHFPARSSSLYFPFFLATFPSTRLPLPCNIDAV